MPTYVYKIDLSTINAAHPLVVAIAAKYTTHPEIAGLRISATFVENALNSAGQSRPHLFLIFQ